MDVKKLISEYFESAQMLQIITTNGYQPWGATVYFAYDQDLNLYWISRPDRRHSSELSLNKKVAGVIAKYHTYGEKVRGIQIEGEAFELKNEDASNAMEIYTKRYSVPRARALNLSGHIVYKLKPTYIVLFDEVNFPENPRQEYKP